MKDNTIDLSITIRGNEADSIGLAQAVTKFVANMASVYPNANLVISYKK